jgi:hypothetical protein
LTRDNFSGESRRKEIKNFLHIAFAADVGERSVAARKRADRESLCLFSAGRRPRSDRMIISSGLFFQLAQNHLAARRRPRRKSKLFARRAGRQLQKLTNKANVIGC